jgi:hypothetical protein
MSREGSHPSKDSLAQLLRALIGYELPVEPVLAALRSFGWDAPEPVVLLTREDIVRILDRYLAGKLTTEQVTDWADLVECREDIGFPSGDEDVLREAVFRLANPNLRGEVTHDLGQIMRRQLVGDCSGTS